MTLAKLNLSPKLLLISSLFLLASTITVVKANNLWGEYKDPPDAEEVDQNTTVSSGSRSNCPNPLPEGSLGMLLPKKEIAHQTISSNPPLYIFVEKEAAAASISIDINLVNLEPFANNPLFQKTLAIKQPGIYKIEIPSSRKVEYDKIHIWQIGIPCKNNTAKLNQVLRGAVKRVPISKELAYQLYLAETPLSQAKAYAVNGIWYDALNYAQQKQETQESVDYVRRLLKNVQANLKISVSSFKNTNN